MVIISMSNTIEMGCYLSCGSSLGTITNDGTTLNASGSGTLHVDFAKAGNLTTTLSGDGDWRKRNFFG